MRPRARRRPLRGALLALLLPASVGAAPPLVAPEGTQPGGLAGKTPPANIADECGSCHSGSRDDEDKLFRPFDTWAGTMMANAMRDPLFLAALSVAEQDAPGVGTYCIRCHSPKGFVKGNASGIGAMLDADDMQGVDCEACHRSIDGSKQQPALMHDGSLVAALEPLDAKAPYIGNARLIWDPRDVRHGPHSDADSPAHAASGSSFTSSSEFCGQCHEVLSPARTLLDATGKDTGRAYPLDTTYSEWKSSAFGRPGDSFKSCIDCHMVRSVAVGAQTASFPSAVFRENPRTHLLVGGNEWGIDAVMKAEPMLAMLQAESFEAAKAATRALLANSVELTIRPGTAAVGSTKVQLFVRVTNLTGHKFPTGYADGRRAFLQVELQDATGKRLAIRGEYDSATATLVPASTLRVWESVQAEHLSGGGHHEWHLVKNDVILKDSRIPPKGFKPDAAGAVVMAPIGVDYGPISELRDYDEVEVNFDGLPPLTAGTLTAVARVFYQSTVREFVEELVKANVTDDRGTKLKAIWEQTGRAEPRLIESATAKLPVTSAGGSGGAGAGGSAGSSGSAGQTAGGSSATGGAPTSGGGPTSGGMTSSGGAAMAGQGNSPSSGCGCRVPASSPSSSSWLWGLALAAVTAVGRRRARRRAAHHI